MTKSNKPRGNKQEDAKNRMFIGGIDATRSGRFAFMSMACLLLFVSVGFSGYTYAQTRKLSSAKASAGGWTKLSYHTQTNSGVKASACKVSLGGNKYRIKVLITRDSTNALRSNLHYYYQDGEGQSQTLTSSSWWNNNMQLHETTVLSSGKVSPNVRLSNGAVDQFYTGTTSTGAYIWAYPGNIVNC